VEAVRVGADAAHRGGGFEGARVGVGEAEGAGVGDDGGVDGVGDGARDLALHVADEVVYEDAGGGAGGVARDDVGEVGVGVDVVVDAHARQRALLQRTREVAELLPRVDVEEEHGVHVVEHARVGAVREDANLVLGVEEGERRRRRAGVDDDDALVAVLEERLERDLRPDGVSVGVDVTRNQERLVRADDSLDRIPHGIAHRLNCLPFSAGGRASHGPVFTHNEGSIILHRPPPANDA